MDVTLMLGVVPKYYIAAESVANRGGRLEQFQHFWEVSFTHPNIRNINIWPWFKIPKSPLKTMLGHSGSMR